MWQLSILSQAERSPACIAKIDSEASLTILQIPHMIKIINLCGQAAKACDLAPNRLPSLPVSLSVCAIDRVGAPKIMHKKPGSFHYVRYTLC